MQLIRVGVIGAGGVAQIEHIPNLKGLPNHFKILGVYDPSATVRNFVAEHFGLPTHDTLEKLLGLSLDAVVIASPDALHFEHIMAALDRGLHVFCEKPLCYVPEDIDALIAARDRSGKVLQVGYMKRFDPSYQAALARMPGTARKLRYIGVEVSDPDAWPFIRHHTWRRGEDVAPDLVASVEAKQRQQVARVVTSTGNSTSYKGFINAYCSSLVHDVNVVHGLLDALEVPNGDIVGAHLFANGGGGQGAVSLLGGQAMWNMVHLAVPGLAEYRERITFYFDDASLELEFPAPWLNHQPTRLTIKRSEGHALHVEDIRTGFEEAFIEELKGFWSVIAEGTSVRNTAEHARRDMALLGGLVKWHVSHGVTA